MSHHDLFAALAESYSRNSIWLLEATGDRRIEWWEICLAAMHAGFNATGANPEGSESEREVFWRAAYEKLETLSESMVSAEELCLR